MKIGFAFMIGALLTAGAASAKTAIVSDPPFECGERCINWTKPHEPFKVYGNTYYVGVGGLSSVLIASKDGLILIDGGLTQSAQPIADHIEQLGFQIADIKLILNSHTHFDHAGGLAALVRASGAEMAASAESAKAIERGGPMPDDPQYEFGDRFPAIKSMRVVADGETLHVGELAITAHYTPGHTPGGTSWTWKSCEGDRCLNMVYADSLNSVSSPGYKFSGHPAYLDKFRNSIATVADLPCDILLTPHPDLIGMEAKLTSWRQRPETNPFIDTGACRAYATAAGTRLDARLSEEK
jgi:metallo-beta-lactamase class B